MELQHTFTVPAPVDQAWSTLLDVEGIAPCFPGAALRGVDGDSFTGTVKVRLGPVSLQYAGKGRFLERDEAAHRVVLEANGSDKRGNGTAGATVHARLEPLGDDETRVVVDTELKVTGRPAQFGRGVLQDVGGRIIEQFATCLATRMASPSEPAPSEPTTPSDAPAPADTAPSEPAASEPTASGTAPSDALAASDAPAASEAAAPVAEVPPEEPTEAATPLAEVPPEEPAAAAAAAARAGSDTAARPTTPPPSPETAKDSAPPAPTAELDLNAVVLPALARRYGPALLAALLALIVVRLIVRRRR